MTENTTLTREEMVAILAVDALQAGHVPEHSIPVLDDLREMWRARPEILERHWKSAQHKICAMLDMDAARLPTVDCPSTGWLEWQLGAMVRLERKLGYTKIDNQ